MLAYEWYQLVKCIMAASGPMRQEGTGFVKKAFDRINRISRMYKSYLENPVNPVKWFTAHGSCRGS